MCMLELYVCVHVYSSIVCTHEYTQTMCAKGEVHILLRVVTPPPTHTLIPEHMYVYIYTHVYICIIRTYMYIANSHTFALLCFVWSITTGTDGHLESYVIT